MSIPLDRLYQFIETVAEDVGEKHVVIYRFYPHGSKKVEDLNQLKHYSWIREVLAPQIYCNDQEPLDYERYENVDTGPLLYEIKKLLKENNLAIPKQNFRGDGKNIFDKALLLHSEQRSSNLERYQKNGFIPVYYWSHGIIARDWFRYACYNAQKKSAEQTFLIYNRAWSGTRQYRLKFLDLIVDQNLHTHCRSWFNPTDSELGQHYRSCAIDSIWNPTHNLENFFQPSHAPSTYSADFDMGDYEKTDIEVVLETLFDDERLHLTEKILRPIACGQPFILAATHGSLQYLRNYGFKTFGELWNEDYDNEVDPEKRLQKIVELMRTIGNWDTETRNAKLLEASKISHHNRQHFFSQKFSDILVLELRNNLKIALDELESTNTSQRYIQWRKHMAQNPEIRKAMTSSDQDRSRDEVAQIVRKARIYLARNV